MPKARNIINQFNVGEVSPLLDARTDVQKYYGACKQLENCICLVQGGIRKRPGSYYVAPVKTSANDTMLYGYQFSTVQSYVLEFGSEYIRFYKEKGQIVVAYAAWANATAYKYGDLRTNGGNYYRCLVNHTSNIFANDLAAGYWVASGGATDLAYEIPTPYQTDELFELKMHPSGDTVRIVHPNHAPRILTRIDHDEWTLELITFDYGDDRNISAITKANPVVVTSTAHGLEVGQWVKFSEIQGMTELNAQYGKITAKATDTFTIGAIDSSAYGAYTSLGVASPLEWKGTAKTVTGATKANPCVITSAGHNIPDGTLILIEDVVGMTELNNKVFTTAGATDDTFQLLGINSSGYGAYTSGGTATPPVFTCEDDFPGAVGAFEQRIAYGGSNNQPGTVWLSSSSNFDSFDISGDGDDVAIEYTLADRTDRVHWLSGQDFLMVGTMAGVWKLGASNSDDALSQSNVMARRQTSYGVKDLDTELVGDSLLYVQYGGRTVRDLYYTINKPDTAGGYSAGNLTAFAEHIAKGSTEALSGIVDMDYQQEPYSILWAVRADGQLLCLVYDREQNLIGWSRMVTGLSTAVPTIDTIESVSEVEAEGTSTITLTITRTENTAADTETWDKIESVAVIKTTEMENEVWLIVKRTVDGSDYRYIEYLKPHEIFSQIQDGFFVDSGLTWDGGDAIAITGITAANPPVVTVASHTFHNSDKVRIYGVEGMTEVNQGMTEAYTVANAAGTTFELSGIDGTAWTAYTEGGYVKEVKQTFTGLSHLEGCTVDVLVDGAKHPQVEVTSGGITLSWYGNLVHVGLPYKPIVQPMQPEISSSGTTQGMTGRIYHLTARFFETYGVQWGQDEDNLYDIPFGDGSTPELYTGDVDYPFNSEVGTALNMYITQNGPFPFTLLALIPKIEKYNDD